MALLDTGDMFPDLTIHQAGAGELNIPDAFDGHIGVVLFYRGSWCPFCNAQLRSFQQAEWALKNAGARVLALSTDDEQARTRPHRRARTHVSRWARCRCLRSPPQPGRSSTKIRSTFSRCGPPTRACRHRVRFELTLGEVTGVGRGWSTQSMMRLSPELMVALYGSSSRTAICGGAPSG